MIQLEIKHLKLITAIVKTRNLTKAASLLCLSQPAVSQQLRELENQLETPLFTRTRKKMILTDVGESILLSAKQILGELDALEHQIYKKLGSETGELKVGIHCAYSFKWIPDVIIKFNEVYPNVRLIVGNSWLTLKELSSKTWDIIITIYPYKHEAIKYSPLIEDEIAIIMNPNHSLADRKFLEATDFENEHYISLAQMENDMFLKAHLKAKGVEPKRFTTVGQAEAVIELVKRGSGLSIFPRWAIREHVKNGELAASRFSSKGLTITWLAAQLSSGNYPGYQEVFLDIVKKHLNFGNVC